MPIPHRWGTSALRAASPPSIQGDEERSARTKTYTPVGRESASLYGSAHDQTILDVASTIAERRGVTELAELAACYVAQPLKSTGTATVLAGVKK